EAADERLRPPRLHEGRQPALRRPDQGQRHDRLALAPVEGARPRGGGPRDPHAPADLPDRVRGPELPQPRTRRARRQAGRIRRDRREDRLGQLARGGVLAVPAAGRPARGRARLERPRRQRRLPDRPRVRERQAEAAVRGLARPAGRRQVPPRLLAVGARAPRDGRDEGHGARAPQGLLGLPHAEDRLDRQPRLLVAELERQGALLADDVEEPGGADVPGPARQGELKNAPRPTRSAALRWGSMPELPEVEITARRLDAAL